MKYLHRYDIGDGLTAMVISDSAQNPVHTGKTLNAQKWLGRALGGNVPQLVARLDGIANWTKDEAEAKEEVAIKNASSELDKLAEEIQPENEHIAKYLDQVSDYLEGK